MGDPGGSPRQPPQRSGDDVEVFCDDGAFRVQFREPMFLLGGQVEHEPGGRRTERRRTEMPHTP
eukprot:519667-Pyramimonas_sp.AAC.1